jgi:hypothetical protein
MLRTKVSDGVIIWGEAPVVEVDWCDVVSLVDDGGRRTVRQ